MAKYRKKPVVIEAEVYKEGMEDYFKYHIPMFGEFTKQECIDAGFTPDFEKDKIPYIQTLEGEHIISPGDYIITGVKGERYPCKADIFHMTYEKVEEQQEDIVEDHEGYKLINCIECDKDKWVEEGTWALDKGMCEPCYCIYQGG